MDLTEFDAHRKTVKTRSGEISYTDTGTGQVAVFVHGLGTNGYLWRNLVTELGDGFRCIVPDLPGHGRSPLAEGWEPGLGTLADSVEDFLDALDLTGVHLVANDTGGAISQIFAVRHPERLATLTLTNCEAHDNLPNEAFRGTVELAKRGELAGLAAQMLTNTAIARSEQSLGGNYENLDHLTNELILAYLGPVAGTPEAARAFERLLSSLSPSDLLDIEPGLRTLQVPTLIVWGDADLHFELSWAHWLHDTIPGAYEVVQLRGAKLHFPDERAVEFAPHLRRHWSAAHTGR